MATQVRAEIVEGPSKFDLMASLFDGKEVEFTLLVQQGTHSGRHTPRFQVQGASMEDGSHLSWNISGYVAAGFPEWKYFAGYFDSRTRKGYMRLSDDYNALHA